LCLKTAEVFDSNIQDRFARTIPGPSRLHGLGGSRCKDPNALWRSTCRRLGTGPVTERRGLGCRVERDDWPRGWNGARYGRQVFDEYRLLVPIDYSIQDVHSCSSKNKRAATSTTSAAVLFMVFIVFQTSLERSRGELSVD
jgi:hypothetical protein